MVLASRRSQASLSFLRAVAWSSPSSSMSKTLPWRTLERPSTASPLSAPSIALPCGSSTLDFNVTITRAFMGRSLSWGECPGWSGRIRGRRHGQERIERHRILGRAQLGRNPAIAQQAGARRQRLEVVCSRSFRGDQHENEIDGESVRGFEIDRAVEPREDPENLLAFGQLAMRNGDTVADSGRA